MRTHGRSSYDTPRKSGLNRSNSIACSCFLSIDQGPEHSLSGGTAPPPTSKMKRKQWQLDTY